jgi:intracellular septation protein A
MSEPSAAGAGVPPMPDSIESGAVVRRVAPRLVRDAFGPLAVFFLGWKLVGLTAGIGAALVFGMAVFAHERRRGRPAVVVRIALVVVATRALVGLSSGSATVYLAQEIAIDTLLGAVVLGSLAAERPFAAWFTEEIQPIPPELQAAETFRRTMRTITLVWGAYFLARALVRLSALLTLSTDQYVVVSALSDAPFLVALLAWSVYYSARSLRASPEWAAAVLAAEAPSSP